jgi:hypothetical protein
MSVLYALLTDRRTCLVFPPCDALGCICLWQMSRLNSESIAAHSLEMSETAAWGEENWLRKLGRWPRKVWKADPWGDVSKGAGGAGLARSAGSSER